MSKAIEAPYIIPAHYRRMENMHIVFWLLKDVSWCMIWKPIGVAMIFPTLIISLVIAYRTRQLRSELVHNLAITFWITANAYWMTSEFFGFDTVEVWRGLTGKHMALIPFIIGILFLANYYLFQRKKEEAMGEVATL